MERNRYSNFDLKTGIIKKQQFLLLPGAVLPRVSGTAPGLCSTGDGLDQRCSIYTVSMATHIYSIYGNQTLLVRQTCNGQEDVFAGGKLIRKCNEKLEM